MIVKSIAQGWLVMHHRAHAMMAAQLVCHLHEQYQTAHWFEYMQAVAFHDDAQVPFDGHSHVNAVGAPMDFRQKPVTLAQAEGVAYQSQFKSLRVALLISLHMSFLYEPMATTDAELAAFCKGQRAEQRRLCTHLGWTIDHARQTYTRILRWADQFSLYLCEDSVPPGGFRVEAGEGPGGETYMLSQKQESQLYVNPWPFAQEKQVEVYAETRTLKRLTYKDDQDLLKALRAADVVEKRWILLRA